MVCFAAAGSCYAIRATAVMVSTKLHVNSSHAYSQFPLSSRLPFPFPCYSISPSTRRALAMAATPIQSSPAPQAVSGTEIGGGEDVMQLINAHQKNAARLPAVEEIRTVLYHGLRGMLSTFSQKYEGYPSGSIVDFASDADGSIILAVSSLSVPSKDLSANPKCSLLFARDPEDRSDLMITVHGDAIPVSKQDEAATRTAYLAKHPNAFWVDFGDFQFLRIEPTVVRYVSGVASALLRSGEFSKEEFKSTKVDPISLFAKPVASHMNRDHGEDTKLIVKHTTSIPVDSAYMLDVDSLGFNVKAVYQGNTYKLRIPFPRRAEERKDLKTLVVEMLEAARGQT
ncbi:unnamed protein product [Linum tenue]|uniref:DUF2470 domain-containing protein n=1 Tax=Linum tenue TaxID=586396 RepID=A0AAV0LF03_9ROSI|nr:unnamed protein product [Linum tenue]